MLMSDSTTMQLKMKCNYRLHILFPQHACSPTAVQSIHRTKFEKSSWTSEKNRWNSIWMWGADKTREYVIAYSLLYNVCVMCGSAEWQKPNVYEKNQKINACHWRQFNQVNRLSLVKRSNSTIINFNRHHISEYANVTRTHRAIIIRSINWLILTEALDPDKTCLVCNPSKTIAFQ